jgi:hypothetical protein
VVATARPGVDLRSERWSTRDLEGGEGGAHGGGLERILADRFDFISGLRAYRRLRREGCVAMYQTFLETPDRFQEDYELSAPRRRT